MSAGKNEKGSLDIPPEIPDACVIGWQARCEVHEQFTVEDVTNARNTYSDVKVISHPECSPEVVEASDYSGSTTDLIRYVQEMEAGRYLLLTECSMGDNIAAENPGREMIRMCSIRCPHMNEIRLTDTLAALTNERYAIEVDPEVSARAKVALDRMISIG